MFKRPSVLPLTLIVIGLILVLGSTLWFIGSTRTTAALSSDISPPIASPRLPYPEVRRIGLGDAKAAFDLGSAVFIDVRGEPYYSQSHIPGALSITEDELLGREEFDTSDWIILYCT